jgi:hypothetical protein
MSVVGSRLKLSLPCRPRCDPGCPEPLAQIARNGDQHLQATKFREQRRLVPASVQLNDIRIIGVVDQEAGNAFLP